MSFNQVVASLLPPQGLAVLAVLALLLLRRRGRAVALVLLVPLLLLAMPLVSEPLLASLDPPASASDPGPGPAPGAIVILSGDIARVADSDDVDIGPLTLERERAGAILARRTKLPVLVTGGIITAPPALGTMMARSMAADFGVTVRWVEARSGTTWENARFSAPMLKADGIGRVYLVTHAWHMRRALVAFRRAGLDAVPFAVRQDPWPRLRFGELLPTTRAWRNSYFAMHEWVGLLYYRLRR